MIHDFSKHCYLYHKKSLMQRKQFTTTNARTFWHLPLGGCVQRRRQQHRSDHCVRRPERVCHRHFALAQVDRSWPDPSVVDDDGHITLFAQLVAFQDLVRRFLLFL